MQKLIYFSLYFSEGAPIGFIWWAMPSILSDKGFSTTEIATISAIAAIPWSFKFIFAPMVDIISMNWVGLKNQLMIYQVAMGVSLFFMSSAIEAQDKNRILSVIIVHGFFAALQDISIDAMAIRSIPKDQVGKINGIMQTGMLVGRSVFGGAGVYLAYLFGLDIMIYFLIGSIWISLLIFKVSSFAEIPLIKISISKYLNDFMVLLKRKSIWILLGITYFAGFSYNGISTIAGAALTKKEVSPEMYGIAYSLILPLFMSVGALLGGFLSDKAHAVKTLCLSIILSIISSLIVGACIDLLNNNFQLIGSYALFYFFIGSTTASLYGFLMKNTTREFAALEFSIFMGIVNLCDSTSSYLTGQLLLSFNYFFTSALIGSICILSLILIASFNKRISFS
jgi:MFS family permease